MRKCVLVIIIIKIQYSCHFSLVRELCYTARRFVADEAKEFGLVR